MDVQRAEMAGPSAGPGHRRRVAASTMRTSPQSALAIGSAERPLILAGGGAFCFGRGGQVALASTRGVCRWPPRCSVWTCCRSDDPLRVGLIGTYGNRWANPRLFR